MNGSFFEFLLSVQNCLKMGRGIEILKHFPVIPTMHFLKYILDYLEYKMNFTGKKNQ